MVITSVSPASGIVTVATTAFLEGLALLAVHGIQPPRHPTGGLGRLRVVGARPLLDQLGPLRDGQDSAEPASGRLRGSRAVLAGRRARRRCRLATDAIAELALAFRRLRSAVSVPFAGRVWGRSRSMKAATAINPITTASTEPRRRCAGCASGPNAAEPPRCAVAGDHCRPRRRTRQVGSSWSGADRDWPAPPRRGSLGRPGRGDEMAIGASRGSGSGSTRAKGGWAAGRTGSGAGRSGGSAATGFGGDGSGISGGAGGCGGSGPRPRRWPEPEGRRDRPPAVRSPCRGPGARGRYRLPRAGDPASAAG